MIMKELLADLQEHFSELFLILLTILRVSL